MTPTIVTQARSVVDQRARFNRTLAVSTLGCWVLIGATVVYLAADIALNQLFGCPPGDGAGFGPEAQFTVIPLGVTCSYRAALTGVNGGRR